MGNKFGTNPFSCQELKEKFLKFYFSFTDILVFTMSMLVDKLVIKLKNDKLKIISVKAKQRPVYADS